jgi:putative ABC transport system permease protein
MLRITLAGLRAHRIRLALTAVTITLGAALVAGTFILTDSVQAVLGGAGVSTPAGLVVVQPSGASGGKGTGGPVSVPAGLAARLRAAGDVAAVQGLVTVAKLTYLGPGGRPINHARAASELLSYPAVPALAAWYTITAGRAPRRGGEALLDAATARSLGYRPGDRIGVATPSGTRDLTITGVTGFGGAASPPDAQIASLEAPTVVVVPPATAQRLAGLPGRFTEIDVLARPGISAAALAARIAPLLPPGIQAVTGGQAAAQLAAAAGGQLGSLRSYLLALCAMALGVAGFVIADTFAVLTAQRTREYALLRLIGAGRGQVLRSALAEAAALGLAASAAGTGLGILAAAGLRAVIAGLGGTLPGADLVFQPRTAAIAIAAGTAVTVAAAVRPARRAARVAPIQALREAQPTTGRRSRGRIIAALAGLGSGAALMAAGATAQGSRNTALAGAGALLAAAAAVTAAPLLAGPVARLATAPVTALAARPAGASRQPARRPAVTAALARDNSAASPRRTAATAAILTIGLAAAVAVSIIAASAAASARQAVTATSRAGLYLQGSIGPRLARAVAARPGVAAVMRVDDPVVQVAGAAARIAGIDPGPAAGMAGFGVRSGRLNTLHGSQLFASAAQAAQHGWQDGSAVTVSFGQGPPRTLRIAGIFTDRRLFGDDYLMPITTLFADMPSQAGQASLLLIRPEPGARLAPVQAAITALLPAHPGTSLLTSAQYQRARATDLGDLSHTLGLLTAMVALTEIIAALGIANTLALSITERRRELAVMRALGLTRRQLQAMIRTESVIMCLLGALPGTIIGTAGGAALAAALTRDQTGLATIAIPAGQLAAALTVTCLIALTAGIGPARRAGRVPALQAAIHD